MIQINSFESQASIQNHHTPPSHPQTTQNHTKTRPYPTSPYTHASQTLHISLSVIYTNSAHINPLRPPRGQPYPLLTTTSRRSPISTLFSTPLYCRKGEVDKKFAAYPPSHSYSGQHSNQCRCRSSAHRSELILLLHNHVLLHGCLQARLNQLKSRLNRIS